MDLLAPRFNNKLSRIVSRSRNTLAIAVYAPVIYTFLVYLTEVKQRAFW